MILRGAPGLQNYTRQIRANVIRSSLSAPRWLQDGSKMAPRWFQDGIKIIPRWLQDGPEISPKNNSAKIDWVDSDQKYNFSNQPKSHPIPTNPACSTQVQQPASPAASEPALLTRKRKTAKGIFHDYAATTTTLRSLG